ncbi:MAG TPA: alpha/beta fold hydrolase, partial [Terriglobales bacterium]
MAQHTLQVNGVRYHAEVEGSGLPLVLLHGFTGSSESWWQIRPALSKQFMTVTVDLLGHGLTEAPEDSQRYTMAFAAQDLAAIFSELQLSYTHLLGYSMGGRLALYLALHHPTLVKTLILESASPGLATEAERADRIQSDERLAR